MTSTTKNVKLGVCRVYYAGADLGVTIGGVEVLVTTATHPVQVDQFGKTAVNELIMSRDVKVKVPMGETTTRNLAATMPGSTLFSDGTQATGALTFTVPAVGTTFTIGGVAFSFVAAGALITGPSVIRLGVTAAASVANAADAINRALVYSAATGAVLTNSAGGVQASIAAATPLVINLTAGDPGVAGNAVTTVAASGATAGAATMTGGVAETKSRLEVTTGVGRDLLSIAQLLRLHPTSKADNDFSDDFVVYQAACAGAVTFAYKVDAERVFPVEFTGYPDASFRLFSIGDLSA